MKEKYKLTLLLLITIILFTGCTRMSKHMKLASSFSGGGATLSETDKALVFFLRPSSYGWAIQSSVFDISDGENKFVGIVSAQTKVAYEVSSGEHLFMTVGESADFMKANLESGKTYYVLVTPRMGAWKARFSLKPVTKAELTGKQFKKWNASCKLIENTESSYKWAEDNLNSIISKKEKYFIKWNAKKDSARPFLKNEDCM